MMVIVTMGLMVDVLVIYHVLNMVQRKTVSLDWILTFANAL